MTAVFVAGVIAGLVLAGFLLTAWIGAAAYRINERKEAAQRANVAPLGSHGAKRDYHRARHRARAA